MYTLSGMRNNFLVPTQGTKPYRCRQSLATRAIDIVQKLFEVSQSTCITTKPWPLPEYNNMHEVI